MREHRNIVDFPEKYRSHQNQKVDFLEAEHPLDLDIDGFVDEMLHFLHEREDRDRPSNEYLLQVISCLFKAGERYKFGDVSCRVSDDGETFSFGRYGRGGLDDVVTFERREIEGYISAFRQRIQERFLAKGKENVHVMGEKRAGSVQMLHSDRVLRARKNEWGRELSVRNKEAKSALYNLPERSPYISYPEIWYGTNQDMSLEKKRDFITLSELMKSGKSTPYAVLSAYRDFALANKFLVERDFRLTDLDISNIGVDFHTGRGFAFDLDGLQPPLAEDGYWYKDNPYLAKLPYYPPERWVPFSDDGELVTLRGVQSFHGEPIRVGERMKQGRATIPEMVYELGSSLFDIAKKMAAQMSNAQQQKILEFAKRMRARNPDERPSLEEVIQHLEGFIAEAALLESRSEASARNTFKDALPPVPAGENIRGNTLVANRLRAEQTLKMFPPEETDVSPVGAWTQVGNPFDDTTEKNPSNLYFPPALKSSRHTFPGGNGS